MGRKIHKTNSEKGFQIRKQIRQAAEKGCRVQLQEPAEDGQEEGVLDGRGGGGRGRGRGSCRGPRRGCCLESIQICLSPLPRFLLRTVLQCELMRRMLHQEFVCSLYAFLAQKAISMLLPCGLASSSTPSLMSTMSRQMSDVRCP